MRSMEIYMRDEVFDIELKYRNELLQLTVKTDYPAGPECMGCDYDIYKGRKHLYTLSHCKNEDEIECWEVKRKPADGHDAELARAIGKAIDKHYV